MKLRSELSGNINLNDEVKIDIEIKVDTRVAPTSTSNWLTENILVGAYPGSNDEIEHKMLINNILGSSINIFISLQEVEESKRFRDYKTEIKSDNIKFINYPIVDRGTIPVEQIQIIVKDIDTLSNNGNIIYLHCYGGHGRSGLIATSYLMYKYGIDWKQAVNRWYQSHDSRQKISKVLARNKLTKKQLDTIKVLKF